jgi:hypothetical protein
VSQPDGNTPGLRSFHVVRRRQTVDQELAMTTIERLLRQSHVFDDPGTYEAGVRDALEAVAAAGELEPRELRELLSQLSRAA